MQLVRGVDKFKYNQDMTQIAVERQVWNYEEIVGQGVPILIMHGWGRSGNEWQKIGHELNVWSGRSVYIVDLPGFGGSSLPKVATIEQYSQSVVKFCEYIGITKAILIGHSLGGRLGIVLAATIPKLVEKLILVDPAGVKPRSFKRVLLKSLAGLFSWVPSYIRAKLVAKLMDLDYQNSLALRDLYRVVVAKDLRDYLPMIECQTTVIWGENDPILPLSQTKLYRQLLSDSQIKVVWGAGHDPHIERYDQTLSFLQEAVE